jgi:hypothetical protein
MMRQDFFVFLGWMMGLEPTTLGTTNRCSNQLSYNHRFSRATKIKKYIDHKTNKL